MAAVAAVVVAMGLVPLHAAGQREQLQKSPPLDPLTRAIGAPQIGQLTDGSGSPRRGVLEGVPSVFSVNAFPQSHTQSQRPRRALQRRLRGQASETLLQRGWLMGSPGRFAERYGLPDAFAAPPRS